MRPRVALAVTFFACACLVPSRARAEPAGVNDDEPRAAVPDSRRPVPEWALGLRAGGGGFLGEGHPGHYASMFSGWAVPLTLEIRRTIVPWFQIGAYGGTALTPDPAQWRFGALGELRAGPTRVVVPWVGLSFGYTAFSVPTKDRGVPQIGSYQGAELSVASGVDLRFSQTCSVGPFVGLSGGFLSFFLHEGESSTSLRFGRFATATLGLRVEYDLF